MALVLRKDSITPLTYDEMDGNFEFLQSEIIGLQSGLSISPDYIRGLFSAGAGITYDEVTGEISFSGGSNVVTSLNGQSGDVVITAADFKFTTSDITEGANQYFTSTRAWDAVKDRINVSAGLTKTLSPTGILIAPRNFNIALVGDVTGSATVSALNDIIINTSLMGVDTGGGGGTGGGITVTEGVIVRSPPTVPGTRRFTGLDFDPLDFLVTDTGSFAKIKTKFSSNEIINIVGQAISGTVFGELTETESGIYVTFDKTNGAIRIAPRDFTITLTGAVTGAGTISRLRDVTINTINSQGYITGLDIYSDVNKVNVDKITEFQFDVNAFKVNTINKRVFITTKNALTPQDVRDIIGNTVQGTEQDVDLSTLTETGIIVTYDRANNTLSVAPRDFTITLAGAVTGSVKISRLRDSTLNVINSNNYISGLDVYSDVNKVNTAKITEFQFDQRYFGLSSVGGRAYLTSKNILTPQDVRDLIGSTVTGTERGVDLSTLSETGIIVTYDRTNNTLSVAPRNFTITLAGAVSGSATISKLRDVTITTNNINNYISGLDVFSDVNKVNVSKITSFRFNQNDFTVTASGQQSLLSLKGALTRQDVRDIIGATVTGTERGVDLSTLTETGIIVTYDRTNNTLSVAPRNFTITLAGAVSGSATISKLRDVTITTNNINNYISGLDVFSDVNKVNVSKITSFRFNQNDFTVTASGQQSLLSLKGALTRQDIRDIIGATVTGTERSVDLSTLTETGIIVTYDRANNTLSVAPRNFTITLAGAVSGSATISKLRDVTITTNNINNYISGLDVFSDANKVNVAKQTSLRFSSTDFNIASSGAQTTLSLKGILSQQDVRDIIGRTVTGTERGVDLSTLTETGIIVTYDRANNTLSVAPRNFTITLAGAVTGTATISKLRDVTLTTINSNNYISGLDVFSDVNKVNVAKITSLKFNLNDFVVSANNNQAILSLKGGLTTQDVKNIIGATVTGSERGVDLSTLTETGIIVTYDKTNGFLSVAPRNFTITLAGAVTGTATISKLRDVTLTTINSNNYISGLDVFSGANKRNITAIKSLRFDETQFAISTDGVIANVSFANQLTSQSVRDIIGATVQGTTIDPISGRSSETGILVSYDSQNNTLSVAPQDFTITLLGDVTGSATISRLRSASITTTTSAIKGIGIQSNSVAYDTGVKNLNFSSKFALTRDGTTNTIGVDIANFIDTATILSTVGNALTGAQNGIAVAYNSANKQYSYNLSNLAINLVGAVTGSATLQYQGTGTQALTLVTSIGTVGSGLNIKDEGTLKGTSISAINFVGGGVTAAVSMDGTTATVSIPNSPGNEKFILIDQGSANVPNARRLVAGTGIVISDAGPGQNVTISASGGQVLGKVQLKQAGTLVAEVPTVNFVDTQQVFFEVTNDVPNTTVNVTAYSLGNGWYRKTKLDNGTLTDKYGNSLDMGPIIGGIIENQINFGAIT